MNPISAWNRIQKVDCATEQLIKAAGDLQAACQHMPSHESSQDKRARTFALKRIRAALRDIEDTLSRPVI